LLFVIYNDLSQVLSIICQLAKPLIAVATILSSVIGQF